MIITLFLAGCGRKKEDGPVKPSTTPVVVTQTKPPDEAKPAVADVLTAHPAPTQAPAQAAAMLIDTKSGNKPIQRDYDQTVKIVVKNDSPVSMTLAGRAVGKFDDLLVDFTGPGSADEPMALLPGQKAEVRLAVTASDAQSDSYDVPITIGGQTDKVIIRIAQPLVKIKMEVLKENPITLAKTIRLVNEGSPLTDLAVTIADSAAGDLNIEPAVSHGNLYARSTMQFELSPVLYYEFDRLETELVCSAAGKQIKFPLKFEAPAGKRLMGYRTASQDRTNSRDYYCTNKPDTCSDLPAGSATGAAPQILLAAAGNWVPPAKPGSCAECPQKDCCEKWAHPPGTDTGGVVCCDGEIYVCVWLEPKDNIREMFRNCVQQHENKHTQQEGECDPATGRYGPKDPDDLPAHECEAWKVTIQCYKESLRKCVSFSDPAERALCTQRFNNQLKIAEAKKAAYCAGNIPPDELN